MFDSSSQHVERQWKLVLLVGIICALVSALVTVAFPLEYRADAQVLIISKTRYGVDPYTVVKSAERVGENIAAIITSNDFFEKVMVQPGFTLDKSYFQNIPERTKRKRWTKSIDASVVYGTGVLNMSAYSTDPNQAVQLVGAAVNALVAQGWEYVGGDVSLKVVNAPVVTRWPVRPNILINALIGLIGGSLITIFVLSKKRQ